VLTYFGPDDHWIADSDLPGLYICLGFSKEGFVSSELHNGLTHISNDIGVTQCQD